MEVVKGGQNNIKFEKSYFDVVGLCCSSEVPLIEKIVSSLHGVKDFSVIVPTKTLIVLHDSLQLSQLQIVKALNEARMEANVRVSGHADYKNRWPSPYAIASGIFLMLSFLSYVYSPLKWLALVAVAVGILPILRKAYAALRNFNLDINILVIITVAGSIALGDYWEAATIVFLFTISEWLESRASHKAIAVMSSLVSVVPQKAVLAETGEEMNADEVKLHTLLAVKAGEVIPIDGVVVEGDCEVDEKILTGESFPVAKQKGSTVWASTINLNGYVTVKTTAMAEDCAVARMAKIVEEAQNKKSRTQRLLDKCAKYYTPAIVVISACLAVVPLALHVHDKKQWYHLALVVLVSGCPCALLLSTPVAMFCALSKAATLGVLFKGAQHFETLAKIKVMAFDKTGTITRGEFLVADFKSLRDDISLKDLLYWISSIECKSSHPMAAALVDYARGHGVEPKPENVENFQNFPGEGISGRFGDTELYIGNLKIASRVGCTAVPELEGLDVEGKSVGYVFLGSSPAVIFCLSDVCRTGAKEAIQELSSMGIKTVMLTGDCQGAAKRAQEQLGGALEEIRAQLLPEDKARVIKELQKEGCTAMIGDGLNDAPALATADIGISMGVSGSALATESGDIVLMSNDIQRIAKALRIAKKVRRKIIENVILSISTKAAIVGLAIAGHPLVWAAVLADVGTCLLVIFNSMLLLKGTSGRGKKCCQSKNKCKLQSCSSKKCDSSGSKTRSCGNNNAHSHNDHHCCPKADQESESQRSYNHGNKKHSSCKDNHGHEGQLHRSHSAKTVKGHQCCSKVDQDLESQRPHNHGNKKHSSCREEHGHEGHFHPHSEEMEKGNQCCGKVDQDLESQRSHNHGNKKHSICMEEHGHEGHFHPNSEKMDKGHQCCSKVEQDLESQRSHNHGNKEHSPCMEEHGHKGHFHSHREKTEKDRQCCSKVDHCLGSQRSDGCAKIVKHEHHDHSTNCKISSHAPSVDEADNHCSENKCMNHKNDNFRGTTLDSHEGKCCEQTPSKHQHCNNGDTLCCKKRTECSSVCAASKKAQRGCCDSYRRECCIRNVTFETNFKGGLSEIVID